MSVVINPNSAYCRCCTANECECQGTDLVLDGDAVACRCCVNNRCECGGADLAQDSHPNTNNPKDHPMTTSTTVETAADKLGAALAANPGRTTVALAQAAGIGRSTAGKLLNALDKNDQVVRRTEEGKTVWYLFADAPSEDEAVPEPTQDLVEETTEEITDDTTDEVQVNDFTYEGMELAYGTFKALGAGHGSKVAVAFTGGVRVGELERASNGLYMLREANGTVTTVGGAAGKVHALLLSEAPKPEPKRTALPEGYVSPTALAKVINERGLYKGNREDGLTTQAMYSYIRNAPVGHPFPLVDPEQVGGRQWVCEVEAGVQWWVEKDHRVAERPARTRLTAAERRAAKRKELTTKLAEALVAMDREGAERSFYEQADFLMNHLYGEVPA